MPPENFSAAWHCLFLSWRGHQRLNGKVCKEKILALLSPAQLQEAQGHTSKAHDKLLFYALANRLGALVHATNEPQPLKPVQSGVTQQLRTELWDSELAPFDVGSPAGMKSYLISRVLVGCCDAVFSGLAYDVGQIVRNPHSRFSLNNMCQLKAVAAMLPGHHTKPMDFQLTLEMYKCLAKIDVCKIPGDSRLALLYVMCSRASARGFPDSLWAVADLPSAQHVHVLSICLDAGPLSFKLNRVDANVGRCGGVRLQSQQLGAAAEKIFL